MTCPLLPKCVFCSLGLLSWRVPERAGTPVPPVLLCLAGSRVPAAPFPFRRHLPPLLWEDMEKCPTSCPCCPTAPDQGSFQRGRVLGGCGWAEEHPCRLGQVQEGRFLMCEWNRRLCSGSAWSRSPLVLVSSVSLMDAELGELRDPAISSLQPEPFKAASPQRAQALARGGSAAAEPSLRQFVLLHAGRRQQQTLFPSDASRSFAQGAPQTLPDY